MSAVLKRTDRGLKKVAAGYRFRDIVAMSRAFARIFGITPRRYHECAKHSVGD